MSKPLELTVYPPIQDCPLPSDFGYAYEDWMDDRSRERQLVAEKRFTDAELAAEYWKASAGSGQVRIYNYGGEEKGVDWEPEAWVMGRFATRPHYDEETP